MGRKPKKPYMLSKSELAWRALEKEVSEWVWVTEQSKEDTLTLLKRLKVSGAWTVAMVEALSELLAALR